MATWGEVSTWRPSELNLAAERAFQQATQWRRQGDTIGARVQAWTGDAAEAAATRAQGLAAKAETMAKRLDDVQRACLRAAEDLTELQTTVKEIQHYATAHGLSIDPSGRVTDTAPPGSFDSQTEADASVAARQLIVDACVARMRDALDQADAIDAALVGALATVHLITPETSSKVNAAATVVDTVSGTALGTYGAYMSRDALNYAEELKARASRYRARAFASDHAPEGNRLLNLADEVTAEATQLRGRANLYKKAANLRALKVGGALTFVGISADIASGTDPTQAIVAGGAGFGASIAAGAATGAFMGSAIPLPILGTLTGAVVGATIGMLTSGAINSIFENGPDAGKAWSEGVRAVNDSATLLVDMGKSTWHAFERIF